MKTLIDTNIVIDVALERYPHFPDSDRILVLSEKNCIEGYLSASTLSDIYYILRRDKSHVATLDFIRKICGFLPIATLDTAVISMALNSNFTDFEEGASHFCDKQLYLDVKSLYGKPFREFIDFQRFWRIV
jgi:predicted nucleic acid-binding protein